MPVARIPNQSPQEFWSALQDVASARSYPGGDFLFQSGEASQGIYLIQGGEVALLLSSPSGAGRLFEKAGPGTMLGLSEAVSGDAHKLSAKAKKPTQASFVSRQDLLEFLQHNQGCCMQIVRLLSEDLHALYQKFRIASASATRSRRMKRSPREERGMDRPIC
jgi:CRP-like cAMP-binding protein